MSGFFMGLIIARNFLDEKYISFSVISQLFMVENDISLFFYFKITDKSFDYRGFVIKA